MIKCFLTLTMLGAALLGQAQHTVYYWFDQQTTQHTLNTGVSAVDCSALPSGVHFAHFQIEGNDGAKSPVSSQAFLLLDKNTANHRTSAVNYWFDQQTTQHTLNTGVSAVDCSALPSGVHFVHFQIAGNDGKKGPVSSQAFILLKENTTPAPSAVNYWFDQQTARTAYSSGEIDLSGLSNGLHALHFQLIDMEGKPCPVRSQYFLNLDFAVHQLCYWFDDAVTYNQITVDDTEISVEQLANGHHTLHVMMADAAGNLISNEEMTAVFTITCPDNEHQDTNRDGVCDVCDELISFSEEMTINALGTICLPKGTLYGQFTGAKFYSIAGKRMDETGDIVSLVLDEENTLTAGQPYIICPTSTTLNITYHGDAVTSPGCHNGLVGSFTGCEVDEGMYLIVNNEIVKCGIDCSIGANQAYINMDNVARYDGVPTINNVELKLNVYSAVHDIKTDNNPAQAYNLSGIRVSRDTKGLVIVNGKKVIQK